MEIIGYRYKYESDKRLFAKKRVLEFNLNHAYGDKIIGKQLITHNAIRYYFKMRYAIITVITSYKLLVLKFLMKYLIFYLLFYTVNAFLFVNTFHLT